ncbi:65-kDa microtubule-associated protein 3-like [Hibiscus syriacus]|uniref:AT-hook motif nuclear-localized protein n=1 Tax=Hibiscus syriacus TaxID=106335 RepID=A0A6A3D3W2_HIBSY|nr:65-kDa microtubule-associated protein 3-like [Hibiscus syriacus]
MPGVTMEGDEGPRGYNVAPLRENPTPYVGPTVSPPPASEMKKKRGRPRKHAPGGSLAITLSPMPISSSVPLAGEFPAWKQGRGRPVDSVKKSHKFELESSAGDKIAYFAGANFTPQIITVNAGEGRFEILSLSGSFIPTSNGVTKSRSGGMSISLAGPDGRVLGGGLAGLLVSYGGVMPIFTSPFNGCSSGTSNPIQGYTSSAIGSKSTSTGDESEGHSLSQ